MNRMTRRIATIVAAGAFALPTLAVEPPLVAERAGLTYLTVALNFTGHPALALPVPRSDSHLPASLQLVGPHYSEETHLPYGSVVELRG